VDGQEPACAQTCPTQSIKFGDHEDMVDQAHDRVAELHSKGLTEARLYGANPNDGVGGIGSVFLILDEPEVYGLPPGPRVPTKDLPGMFAPPGAAALGMVAAAGLAFLGRRRCAHQNTIPTVHPSPKADAGSAAEAVARVPEAADAVVVGAGVGRTAVPRAIVRCRWSRTSSSRPTTADPSSRPRPGVMRSGPTCSSAASPEVRPCWASVRRSATGPGCVSRAG